MTEENVTFLCKKAVWPKIYFLQCSPKFIRGGPGVQFDINFRNKENRYVGY